MLSADIWMEDRYMFDVFGISRLKIPPLWIHRFLHWFLLVTDFGVVYGVRDNEWFINSRLFILQLFWRVLFMRIFYTKPIRCVCSYNWGNTHDHIQDRNILGEESTFSHSRTCWVLRSLIQPGKNPDIWFSVATTFMVIIKNIQLPCLMRDIDAIIPFLEARRFALSSGPTRFHIRPTVRTRVRIEITLR